MYTCVGVRRLCRLESQTYCVPLSFFVCSLLLHRRLLLRCRIHKRHCSGVQSRTVLFRGCESVPTVCRRVLLPPASVVDADARRTHVLGWLRVSAGVGGTYRGRVHRGVLLPQRYRQCHWYPVLCCQWRRAYDVGPVQRPRQGDVRDDDAVDRVDWWSRAADWRHLRSQRRL